MTRLEIKNLINDIYHAVDESDVGPIFHKTEVDEKGNPILMSVPLNVFYSVLGHLMPSVQKHETHQTGKMDFRNTDPGDDWKIPPGDDE